MSTYAECIGKHRTRHAGFFFGRTPLIKLSPKKTWEGFSGGLVLTVISSWYLAEFMSRYKWMICPRTVRTCLVVLKPYWALTPDKDTMQHMDRSACVALSACKPKGRVCHAIVKA